MTAVCVIGAGAGGAAAVAELVLAGHEVRWWNRTDAPHISAVVHGAEAERLRLVALPTPTCLAGQPDRAPARTRPSRQMRCSYPRGKKASVLGGEDVRATGLTAERLGIAGLDRDGLLRLVRGVA